MTQHDDDRPSASDDVVEFPVAFTGVITDVSFVSIDPSGRSDLLKIIDEALSRRSIAPLQSVAPQSHRLSISRLQLCIRSQSTQLVQLRVPLHIIASVGYMLDDGLHIVCINIGPDPLNRQTRDLAVITVTCKAVADDVCRVLSSRFQSRYREAVVRLTDANVKSIKST
ncbi:hypothetical protein Q1695_007863 [Nippostrongylus brasiliensis]|nr:hypothetical protein Q1695_007863 [Nippostrongylus brasiliensis]